MMKRSEYLKCGAVQFAVRSGLSRQHFALTVA
jgi:hypothetical protein